jgi:hypothetical protein
LQPTLEDEVTHLRGLDLKGLRARWRGVFRRDAPQHLPRHLLFGILAYRIQADRLGELDPSVKKLLDESPASKPAALRRIAKFDVARRSLIPGTVLVRQWRGRPQRVMVMTDGFGWNGKTFDSLSSVAFAITGTRWNGPRFFGLRDRKALSEAAES